MQEIGQYLARMRETAPLVHNITNYVAMDIMANVLLAAGAAPAMVHANEEVAEFAGLAQALTVNIGTLDPDWARAMETAAAVMQDRGLPWVLDPVGIGATTYRRKVCARLLDLRPTIIRGNASEVLALAGLGAGGRGPETTDSVDMAAAAARDLAQRTGGIVAVSGPVDYVTDGQDGWHISNGHPLMTRVTALGCALNGVIGAFVSGQDRLQASVAALAYYGLAGERAAGLAAGPGTFAAAFLDQLSTITPADLTRGAKVSRA
jgi:hydroxyethylthiazole kinase